jgi:hypothetical protein
MPVAKDRRPWPPLDAVRNRSRIRFESPSGPRRAAAILVNVSPEGALIVTTEPPAPDQRIWLRIEEPVKTGWVAAVAMCHSGGNEVGLRFLGPRPDGLLLAALLGIDVGPDPLCGRGPESVDHFAA